MSDQRTFLTTTPAGLDHELLPMKLWQKAKRLGIWNPVDIDFTEDREHWARLEEVEKQALLHLTSLFQAGEESVVIDLLPLISVVAKERRLEEEIYLTSFLWEEAKHVEVFRRFLDEVAEDRSDLARFHSHNYRRLFYEALPQDLLALWGDTSPPALARASVTYNMIVEGVLAETGYHAYYQMLSRNRIMPGMQKAVRNLQSDEARHLAYGVYLLSRLIAAHGDPVWDTIDRRMNQLVPVALGIIQDVFSAYEVMPFGLELDEFSGFALTQFQKRFARLEKARGADVDEVERAAPYEELPEVALGLETPLTAGS
ncbi:MAG: R2-like ligand-binding oxidase [Thermoanaerobaculia bacterium]